MFNNEKRVKQLEDDVRTLYSIIGNPQEELCKEQIRQNLAYGNPGCLVETSSYEPKYAEISVSSVVSMILKRMGVEIKYTPPVTPRTTPSKFKLVKKERGTV